MGNSQERQKEIDSRDWPHNWMGPYLEFIKSSKESFRFVHPECFIEDQIIEQAEFTKYLEQLP